MERFRYDRSSKWLIEHHGNLILRLGNVLDVQEWRAVQAEVVQPRQLPDGLLEVRRRGDTAFHPYVIEIETFPDPSTCEQLLDDMMLVYQDRRELPDVLVLVLRRKGNLRIASETALRSRCGMASFRATWRVVELWNLKAADLLATGEPGLVPWVPLARIEGPVENTLRECRRIIDEKSTADEHDNLLAVSQVLLGLNYNDPKLLAILGGREAMIESPVLDQFVAERVAERVAEELQQAIIGIVGTRFGTLPPELTVKLGTIIDEDRLQELVLRAASCPNLEAFTRELDHSALVDGN